MSADEEEIVCRWLPYRQNKDDAVLRLWSFHWFGASASAYGTWDWELSDDVELCAVQLPGRENRKEEEPFTSAAEAACAIVKDLLPLFREKRYCLFGHSSGTWIAYEVAMLLRKEGLPPPLTFFVSNFPAPQTSLDLRPWKASNQLAGREFQQEVQSWGLPDILFEDNAWKAFEPLLRKEFAVFDEYEYNQRADRLSCPFAAFISQDDPKVGPKQGNPELMEGWGHLSTQKHMTVDVFFGDHFYLQDSVLQKAVAKTVAEKTTKLADLLTFDL